MIGCSVMIVLGAVMVATANSDFCNTVQPLGECEKDEGISKPEDQQIVYLRDLEYHDSWLAYDGGLGQGVSSEYNPTQTITETDKSPQWIWHDCGLNLVCLESAKYRNYYLIANADISSRRIVGRSLTSEILSVKYRYSSQILQIFKFTYEKDSSGVIKIFHTEKFPGGFVTIKKMIAHIYIPPRCEGYLPVGRASSINTQNGLHKYTYTTGVTRTNSRSTTVSNDMAFEVTNGILSASFAKSWTHEKSSSVSETKSNEISYSVPSGKMGVVWQHVATYGTYKWFSADLRTCVYDI